MKTETTKKINQLRIFNFSSQSQSVFTFVDLFAGIGGFRIALEQLGGKCLGYSEIDQQAIQVYQNNFITYANAEEKNLGDITKIPQLPFDVDIIVGGVPCQPWSIAGKLQGFNDPRGKLWFDVIRLVKNNKPKGFIFENVKGLIDPRNQESFAYIVNELQQLGYLVNYQLVNSYDFGLAQDRERVFLVGVSRNLPKHSDFRFPQPLNNKPKLYQFISGIDCQEFTKKKFSSDILFEGKSPGSRGRFKQNDELNDFFMFTDLRDGHTTIHSWDLIRTTKREKLICETILKNRRKKKYGPKDGNPLSFTVLSDLLEDLKESELENLVQKNILRYVENQGYEFVNSKISTGINGVFRIFLPHSDVIGTLTASEPRDFVSTITLECQEPEQYKETFLKEIYRKRRFKTITVRDYAKLQGFPDWFIIAENEHTAKQQFGNAVSVPVVYHIAKSLLEIIDYRKEY